MTQETTPQMRRLRADRDPVTLIVAISDQDTSEVLWTGPPEEIAAAVRAIREQEAGGDAR